MRHSFENISLDSDRYELRRAGDVIRCEPKVFDLIRVFVENPGRVLSKDELIDLVWSGRIVSDTTVSTCIKAARRALGDTGKEQRFIRTIHGRGFRFEATSQPEAVTPAAVAPPQPAFQTPSLLIAPIRFADTSMAMGELPRVADRLRVALGRVPFLAGVPRRVSETLAAKPLPEIVAEIGAGYLMDMAIDPQDDRVHASSELIDTKTGSLVWSRSVDVEAGQGASARLIEEILPQLEPALVQALYTKLQQSGERSARPLVIQAYGVLSLKGWHGESFNEAETLLREAMQAEPDLAFTRAVLALVLALGQRVGFERAHVGRLKEAIGHAENAMAQAPMDSTVMGLSGCALADAGHPKRALPILERAIELNPDNAHAHAAIGATYLVLRDPQKAVDHLVHGIALSPYDNRLSIWLSILAQAQLVSGDPDTAIETARRAVAFDDKTYLSRIVLARVHIARGEMAEAEEAVRECRRVRPGLDRDMVAPVLGEQACDQFMEIWERLN